MEQQQAVEFTQKALARGATPEQVAYVLAERMNAPVEAILRFVQRIAAQQAAPPPPAVPEMDAPAQAVTQEWEETPEPVAVGVEEPATMIQGIPIVAPPVEMPESLPPPTGLEAAAPYEMENAPVPNVEAEAQAATAAEAQVAAPAPNPTRPRGRMSTLYQDPAVQEMVLKELKRSRKPADIAVKLSEQYGVRWTDAQRYVEEISVRYHSQAHHKLNVPVLIFSGLALLAGLALLVTALLGLIEGLTGQPADRLSQIMGTLMGGALLTAGGVIGLYITFRPSGQ
jgi:hypothetical protein